MQETRKERCSYGYEKRLIDRLAKFGWQYSSKQLLNRYGNPLPLTNSLTESEKQQKCFLDVTFVRDLEEGLGPQINSLEDEYNTLIKLETSFTIKRVGSLIFLTFVLFVLLLLGFLDAFVFDNPLSHIEAIVFFVLSGIVALLMGLIIATGIVRAIKNGKTNEMKRVRKYEIEGQVTELLGVKSKQTKEINE